VLAAVATVLVTGCTDSPPSNATADVPKITAAAPRVTPPADETAGDPARDPAMPPPMRCNERSTGIIDYVGGAKGEPDLQTAFDSRAEPGETAVIIKNRPHSAVARYVDKDGSTQAQVMAYDGGNGWLISTVERCA